MLCYSVLDVLYVGALGRRVGWCVVLVEGVLNAVRLLGRGVQTRCGVRCGVGVVVVE